jgi:O-antigen biosynthesis protein
MASTDSLRKEIIVVDNASTDGTTELIRNNFSNVNFIQNQENLGFSKANNQAIKEARGKYTLILNPDTILSEDTLTKCYTYLESNLDFGAVGVRMVDGSGKFLPESKRGIPSVLSSMFKFSGLSSIFKNNSLVNHYYLGHLDENMDHEIEVLTGAFLFIRTQILNDLEGFDNAFFMYGEDIDLCKRISELGYKIGYLGSNTIVHFKGESTKSDWRYVSRFYGAMIIYYKKHSSGFGKILSTLGLTLSIFILASLSFLKTNFLNYIKLIFDFTLLFLGFVIAKLIWSNLYFTDDRYFKDTIFYNFIVYALVLLLSFWYFGWYERFKKIKYLSYGLLVGIIGLLVIYSLLPENLRYSRALIFLGSGFGSILVLVFSYIISAFGKANNIKYLIVSSAKDEQNLVSVVKSNEGNAQFIGRISPTNELTSNELGMLTDIQKVVTAYQPNLIVFNSKDLSNGSIIESMMIPNSSLRYMITSVGNSVILGSESKNRRGKIYEIEPLYRLAKAQYRRLKRIIDIIFSIIFLLIFPILLLTKRHFIIHSFNTILGSKTWIGYIRNEVDSLPPLLPHYFNTNKLIGEVVQEEIVDDQDKADLCYAKYYHPFQDLLILYRNLTK